MITKWKSQKIFSFRSFNYIESSNKYILLFYENLGAGVVFLINTLSMLSMLA